MRHLLLSYCRCYAEGIKMTLHEALHDPRHPYKTVPMRRQTCCKFPSFTCKTVVPASTSTGFPSTNTSTIVPAARDCVRTEKNRHTDVSMSSQVATTSAVQIYHLNMLITSAQMNVNTQPTIVGWSQAALGSPR